MGDSKRIPGFDRDLSFAGRAMVKMPDGGIVQKLIHVKRPSIESQVCSFRR